MAYAKDTSVSVDRTKAEIERTLTRYGATAFVSGWQGQTATLMFEVHGRRIRLRLELPDREAPEFLYQKVNQSLRARRLRAPQQREQAWEQACRQKWRALLLVIKTKLEAIDAGITTLDDEFLAGVMLPSGETVGEWAEPQIRQVYESGRMPPLLPGAGPERPALEE